MWRVPAIMLSVSVFLAVALLPELFAGRNGAPLLAAVAGTTTVAVVVIAVLVLARYRITPIRSTDFSFSSMPACSYG